MKYVLMIYQGPTLTLTRGPARLRGAMEAKQIPTLCTWIGVALTLGLAVAAPICVAAPAAEQPPMSAELRRSTQALLDAIAPGDVAVWDRLLDEKAIQVDENDVVRNKKEILAELKPLGVGLTGHLMIDDFRVVAHGDTAIVTHEDDEYLDYHGQVIRSRFRMTDTWIRSGSGWKELASQVLAVLKDPPVQELDDKVLCEYSGTYAMTEEIKGTFRCVHGELLFERTGRPVRHFRPELRDVFFEPGEPRTRRIFTRGANGAVAGFVDRREARDIVWRRTEVQ
jgi:hypothetical protein